MKGRSGWLIALVIVVIIIAVPIVVMKMGSREPFQPSNRSEKVSMDVMQSDLMALARQESFYYRTHGRFTVYPESTYFLQSLGVSAPKVTLRDSGYYAIVTHSALPGVKCGIAVGTENPIDKSAKETFPACR